MMQNEVDCAYFLRTGHCKFGATCKFNHPQPQPTTSLMVPTSGQQQSYPWSRASFIASPRWQDPSGFTPLIMPQGVVWNPYSVSCVQKQHSSSDSFDFKLNFFHFLRVNSAQFLLQVLEMNTTTIETCSKTSQAPLFSLVRMFSRRDRDNLNASSTWRQETASLAQFASFIILEIDNLLLLIVSWVPLASLYAL